MPYTVRKYCNIYTTTLPEKKLLVGTKHALN